MSIVDRNVRPPFHTTNSIKIQWPKEYKLENDFSLFVLNSDNQSIIELDLVCRSGSWYESQNGIAYFTAKMLEQGTKKKGSQEIANYIEQYGASLYIAMQPDFFSIGITVLSKHFKTLLTLFAELLFESIFPEDALELLKNIKTQSIKVANTKNDVVAHQQFRALLFTEQHPYGKTLTMEDVAIITVDQVKKYYANQLLTHGALFMSGQVKENDINLVIDYLKPLVYREPAALQVHSLPFSAPRKIYVERKESLQAAINIGKKLIMKDHPDYFSMVFVNILLGGYFGSRLMSNIREEKGYTYGIYSKLMPCKHSGYFCILTEVIQQFLEQTCEEIYKEIKLLQTELTPHTELNKLKNYILGNFLSHINDPFSVMKKFQEVYLYGLHPDCYGQFFDIVKNITPEDIRMLTQKYLPTDSFSQVIVD